MNTMTKQIFHFISAMLVALGAASLLVVAAPQTASAACQDRMFTFPTWYRGLVDDSCEIIPPDREDESSLSNFIWKIVLNIIDMIMQLVGYASVAFLIIGGFRYMTSTGDSTKMTAAKSTIMNAIIGLVIALASVAIVNTIAGII